MDELRACPFCGNSNICLRVEGDAYFCYCEDCGTEVTESYDRQSAINYWNTRPIEERLRELLRHMYSDYVTPAQFSKNPVFLGVVREACKEESE